MGGQVDKVPRHARAGADPALVLVARRLKAVREAISGPIAPLLVQNPALDLLLALFIAESDYKLLNEEQALAATGVGQSSGRRWFVAMLAAGLVEHVGEFVALTEDGRDSLMQGLGAGLNAVRLQDPIQGVTRP